jgi:hypothetical protein
MTFWEKMEHFEKFWENFIFFGIPPFTLVFALSFATWKFWEKNGTFWELLRKKWNILRNFEKNPGPTRTLSRALCEKPYRSSPPFCAPEQVQKTFEKFMYHPACL